MTVIGEKYAWAILARYAAECAALGPDTLIAVVAIGSLPGGYYRSGQSDIDAVLIVEDGSRAIWGSHDEPSTPLSSLNEEYLSKYAIPKDFGPFPLEASDLFPPYRDVELIEEIVRLKVQGRPVYGSFDLQQLPMPGRSDVLRSAVHFEKWFEEEFLPTQEPEDLSATACANTILIHLKRYLHLEHGIVEFSKPRIIGTYLRSDPPIACARVFALIEKMLEGCTPSQHQLILLRRGMVQIRDVINDHLGIPARFR